jgi:ferredoxin
VSDAGVTYFLSDDGLARLVDELAAAGTPAIGPARDGAAGKPEYREVRTAAELAFNEGLPALSLKGFFLPMTETLLTWQQKGGDVRIAPAPTTFAPRVVLGAKPCDVAALAIVDKVMNWDYQDELWNGRRAATTVFSLACDVEDDYCFCGAVGVGPDSARGADGLLTPVGGGYVVRTTSEKGEAFVAAHRELFGDGDAGSRAVSPEREAQAKAFADTARARVAANLSIDTNLVKQWIDTHFEDPFWEMLGPRCNGCGACAAVCPTCHCFDIVDEEEGVGRGARRRNWDTCQTCEFTLHASGHNPRDDQNARFRQRVNHKFLIYPMKFGDVLCTGCGRCSRACPAGQDLAEILASIDAAAAAESEGAA